MRSTVEKGKKGSTPHFFYLRTVDWLTIKGRVFNTASAFTVENLEAAVGSFKETIESLSERE